MFDISVIVPVYNSEKYIEKCLDSLVSQTIKSYEIIIVNDGSTDQSLDVIKKYSLKNKNIKIINTENNGIGVARNIGLKHAKGKYVAFVDSDDYVSPLFLERMLNTATDKNADIVVCDMYKVFGNDTLKDNKIMFKNGNIKDNKEQLINIPLGPCGKLFLKAILTSSFAENLKYEDVPFVASALLNSKNTIKLNEYLYYYIIHDKSETTSMDERVFDILKILSMTNSNLRKHSFLKEETEYLNIVLLSRYNLQQGKQKQKELRIKFLNDTFSFLNNNFPNWKKNVYFKKEPIFKQIIKTHKLLIHLCWFIYN